MYIAKNIMRQEINSIVKNNLSRRIKLFAHISQNQKFGIYQVSDLKKNKKKSKKLFTSTNVLISENRELAAKKKKSFKISY